MRQLRRRPCAPRSIRPESRTHVAEMTEVIAAEANKRDLAICVDHIDRRIETRVPSAQRSPPPTRAKGLSPNTSVGIDLRAYLHPSVLWTDALSTAEPGLPCSPHQLQCKSVTRIRPTSTWQSNRRKPLLHTRSFASCDSAQDDVALAIDRATLLLENGIGLKARSC